MDRTGTPLRHDLMYLRCIVTEAVRLHPGRTPEDRVMLTDLREYLMWLTVDALQDETLARELVSILARLQEELNAVADDRRARHMDPTAPAFYEAFLRAMEQMLSFRYGEDLLVGGEISRGEFLHSWERTRQRLGL